LRTQSVAKKTFFNQPVQRAGAFRNFSKSSRSVQERFETFQSLPAACRSTSKLFKVFPQRAGTLRNFSKPSRSVQELFYAFQTPAATNAQRAMIIFSLVKKESKFLFTVNTGLLKGIENEE
jgi:hypothetical protein